jgi:hypothetical protein
MIVPLSTFIFILYQYIFYISVNSLGVVWLGMFPETERSHNVIVNRLRSTIMSTTEKAQYIYNELRDNYDDSFWWRNKIIHRALGPIHRHYPSDAGSVHVMDEDWDNLFVLDGCRADLFEAEADFGRFDGYTQVRSPGSMTAEWVEESFTDRAFGDTVYVSGNPYVSRIAGDAFHAIESVWRDTSDRTEMGTVHPATMADAARQAATEFPDKRLIVHFMQPHYPFIDCDELFFSPWDPDESIDGRSEPKDRPHNAWQALQMGLVERDVVWDAYANNLRLVLPHVLSLADDVQGRTVVTADHGNLFGERGWPIPIRVYGHPQGLRTAALTTVPWATIDGERRTVIDDGTHVVAEDDDAKANERLRALGYVES